MPRHSQLMLLKHAGQYIMEWKIGTGKLGSPSQPSEGEADRRVVALQAWTNNKTELAGLRCRCQRWRPQSQLQERAEGYQKVRGTSSNWWTSFLDVGSDSPEDEDWVIDSSRDLQRKLQHGKVVGYQWCCQAGVGVVSVRFLFREVAAGE